MTSHDPFIPLEASCTHFHQTGATRWQAVEAGTLTKQLQSESPPEFRSVLAIVGEFDENKPRGEIDYKGPMYIDLDGESIEEAVKDFQATLNRFKAIGLDLNMVRTFASGGRGFHLEIPMPCFMAQVPEAGVRGLPGIYKEMVWGSFVTDSTDLRVYSGGRGRQWRVPNRQRSNGNFKVPLTVEETLNITPETYAALVAAPRRFPPLTPPKFCPELALIYTKARDKVAASCNAKRKGNPSKTAELLQVRCKAVGAALPPSLLALGAGLIEPREGIGFNQLAIQLCTAAHAMNMPEGEFLSRCAGLINNHKGDGSRYGTPARREAALREMFRYIEGNPCYEFSAGGVRSIFPASASLNDLRGL